MIRCPCEQKVDRPRRTRERGNVGAFVSSIVSPGFFFPNTAHALDRELPLYCGVMFNFWATSGQMKASGLRVSAEKAESDWPVFGASPPGKCPDARSRALHFQGYLYAPITDTGKDSPRSSSALEDGHLPFSI